MTGTLACSELPSAAITATLATATDRDVLEPS
jgi:hypothetical protein